MKGDIEGLKLLFPNGLASPRDVSTTRGYSVLRWMSMVNTLRQRNSLGKQVRIPIIDQLLLTTTHLAIKPIDTF